MTTAFPMLRPAQRRDLAAIHDLEQATFGRRGLGLDELAELLGCFRGRAFVAVHERELWGYIVATVDSPWIELRTLAVDPLVRRRTIGQQLVRAVCRLAAVRGLRGRHETRLVRAMVAESQLAAQQLLKAEGFRAARLVRNYYAPHDEGAICMVWRPWPVPISAAQWGQGG